MSNNITITIKGIKTEKGEKQLTLTMEQAKYLFEQLKTLLEEHKEEMTFQKLQKIIDELKTVEKFPIKKCPWPDEIIDPYKPWREPYRPWDTNPNPYTGDPLPTEPTITCEADNRGFPSDSAFFSKNENL
jgi:hypothetical protein